MKKLGGETLLFILAFYLLPCIAIAATIGFQLPIKENFTTSLTLGESWKNGAWLFGHMGDDLVVGAGTNVYAVADGKVVYVKKWPLCDVYKDVSGVKTLIESDHGWGGVVIIEHRLPSSESFIVQDSYITSDGIDIAPRAVYTQYGHLGNILVEEGQEISFNQKIAEVGDMCKWRPHLHFEVKSVQGYNTDLSSSSGAGFGYSGTDAYAPYRYIPSKFVELNKAGIVEEATQFPAQQNSNTISNPNTSPSFWQKIKLFFSDVFSHSGKADTQSEQNIEPIEIAEKTPEMTQEKKETPTSAQTNATFLPAYITITALPGQTDAELIIFAKNTGNTTWLRDNTSLNVVGGSQANIQFHHSQWVTQLRPTLMKEATVLPGDVGSFAFRASLPEDISQIFHLQLVQQQGSSFTQIGSQFVQVAFAVKEKEEKTDITEQTNPQDENTFFEKLNTIQDVLGEKISEVFQDIAKIIPNTFFGGGSGTQDTQQEEQAETDEEPEEDTEHPEITITSPTTTMLYTTVPTTTLHGTSNEDVALITVNGTSTQDLVLDIVNGVWKFSPTLQEYTTSTFTFIGWNAESTVSSTSHSVSYYYERPAPPAPEISITSPTSSVIYVTSMPVTIAGVFSDQTSYLTINGVTSSVFVYDATRSEWSIELSDIPAHTTTTYEFVGWSAESTTSSSPVSIDVLYEPQIVPLAKAPTILTPTASGEYTTHAISVQIGGTAPTGTVSVALVAAGVTTTVSVEHNAWMTSIHLPGTGVYDVVAYGVSVAANISASISLVVHVERYTEAEYISLSEIAWMGTKAAADDEWFEVMIIPPEEGGVPSLFEDDEFSPDSSELFRVVWGTYDSETGLYDHTVSFHEEDFALIQGPGAPIDIGQGNRSLQPSPIQIVFERTSSSTLRNASGIVYTGLLKNTGERMLVLLGGTIIVDDVDARNAWFEKGDNTTKQAMHRIDPTLSGSDPGNWCTFDECSENTQYLGEAQALDAGGNLVHGSPYSPNIDISGPYW